MTLLGVLVVLLHLRRRNLNFYHTMLCVSAVFAVARYPSVRLSFRLAIRHVGVLYCIQTAEDIVKLLSRPGSSMILVF